MPHEFQSEFVEWSRFIEWWKWRQGEHLTAIGPTGVGKTTFIVEALRKRDFVLFFATKKKDSTVDKLRRQGYKVVSDYREIQVEVDRKVIIKPPFPNVDADELKRIHRNIFREALMWVFRTGAWCVVADELKYLTENLGLKAELELLWLQGRSLKITVAGGTQRPRKVPLEAFDMATHLVFWRDSDRSNRERIAEISGIDIDPRELMREVASLPPHQLLYVNTRTGEGVRTKVEV